MKVLKAAWYAVLGVFAVGVVLVFAQVAQRPLNQAGLTSGWSFGTALPTVANDGRPPFDGEPYFQGAVLSDYRGGGVWPAPGRVVDELPALAQNEQGLVRQDTVVETGGDKVVVFAVAPFFGVADSPVKLKYNSKTKELLYISQHGDQRRFEFRIATSAFRDGRLAPARPADIVADQSFTGNYLESDRLRLIAEEILFESGITKDAGGKPENIAARYARPFSE